MSRHDMTFALQVKRFAARLMGSGYNKPPVQTAGTKNRRTHVGERGTLSLRLDMCELSSSSNLASSNLALIVAQHERPLNEIS